MLIYHMSKEIVYITCQVFSPQFSYVSFICNGVGLDDAVIRNHTVKYKGDEVHNLNELEYVAGEIWANVWQVC